MERKKKTTFTRQIMRSMVLSIVSMLVLCCTVILLFTYITMSSFVQKDLVFFQTQLSEQLEEHTANIEAMVAEISRNTTITQCLEEISETGSTNISRTAMAEALTDCTDLYSAGNTDSTETPMVDMVYLFDARNSAYRSLFFSYTRQERYGFDQLFQLLNNQFINSGNDRQFFVLEDSLIIAYPVYSSYMQRLGTVLFSLNQDFITQLFEKAEQSYPGTNWVVTTQDGRVVAQSSAGFSETARGALFELPADTSVKARLDGQSYVVYRHHMPIGLSSSISIPRNLVMDTLFRALVLPIVSVFGLTFLLMYYLNRRLHDMISPLQDITRKLQVVNGETPVKLPAYPQQEFQNISQAFNSMTDRIDYLINDVYKKQLMLRESELKFLQSQMNPHFMFNVLNTIALKAKLDKNEDVYQMTSAFSQLMQASIYRKNTDKVTLREELKCVEFYLYLQKYRFGEKLSYEIVCEDDELLEYYIPKLAIQVLVENAVVHGLENLKHPGTVIVDISAGETGICVQVIDDGSGFEGFSGRIVPPMPVQGKSSAHNHIGLNNTQQIIQYYYGSEYGLVIDTEEGAGTTVTLHIPCDPGTQEE